MKPGTLAVAVLSSLAVGTFTYRHHIIDSKPQNALHDALTEVHFSNKIPEEERELQNIKISEILSQFSPSSVMPVSVDSNNLLQPPPGAKFKLEPVELMAFQKLASHLYTTCRGLTTLEKQDKNGNRYKVTLGGRIAANGAYEIEKFKLLFVKNKKMKFDDEYRFDINRKGVFENIEYYNPPRISLDASDYYSPLSVNEFRAQEAIAAATAFWSSFDIQKACSK